MRRMLALVSGIALLLVVGIAPATAAGYCNLGSVTLYQNGDFTGASRTFCYGIDDNDIETEAISTPIGPLNTGAYLGDFDPSETQSGVLSARYNDASDGLVRICFYTGKNYSGNYTYRGSSGTITWSPLLTPGSLRFRNSPGC